MKTVTPFSVLAAGDMSASVNSTPVRVEHMDLVCFQAVFTGAPAGTLKIQASLDPASDDIGTGIVTWTDVPSNTLAVSAAGSGLLSVIDCPYRWVRVSYVRTSGTGSLTVTCNLKGRG